jgi:phosphate transport system permease protein
VNGADAIKKQLGDNFRSEKTISYSGGGILGPIVGTALLVIVSVGVALFLGVACAIYLSEYAKHGKFLEMVRLAILNLAGVPSVVFGLFGLGAFVLTAPVFVDVPADRSVFAIPLGFTTLSFEGWDTCVLSGGFTLAFVILPVIITASEQCLQAVPQGFRETSMALGATRWQTIWRSVLPFATPGILTSSILGIARAAGETAPIMFTAALAFKDKLPWQKDLPPLPADAGMFRALGAERVTLPRHLHREPCRRCRITSTPSPRRSRRTNTPSARNTAPSSSSSSSSPPWPPVHLVLHLRKW